jgi:hypothetical protein
MKEVKKLTMPRHHEVQSKNVDLKRLGSILALANEKQFRDFESLLLLNGLGPRTVQSLTLISEIIFGTPSRFKDPARFSFAHGGKDGHPFPVPLDIYDESINVLQSAVTKSKMGYFEKQRAIRNLGIVSQKLEKNFMVDSSLDQLIQEERRISKKYNGRTVFDRQGLSQNKIVQLSLF